MKTTIKTTWRGEQSRKCYPYNALENAEELTAIVNEYEALLQPCIHCGLEHPCIEYLYCPSNTIVPGKKHPHKIHAHCWYSDMFLDSLPSDASGDSDKQLGCKIQTAVLYAEDDDNYADLKEALRMIVAMWNRRPCDTVDPAVKDVMLPQTYLFANQEEAKEYCESKGERYDENAVYLEITH